jgi:hypothetical protein
MSKKKIQKKVYDVICLDRSGSMKSIINPTITGFNEYVETIKEAGEKAGVQSFVTLIQFNGKVEVLFKNESVDKLEKLTTESYIPKGNTALNDSISVAIDILTEAVGEKDNENVDVTLTIISDGAENSSSDYPGYGNKEIAQLIKDCKENRKWTINFVGAGNAMQVNSYASSLNIGATNTLNYSADIRGATMAFSKMSASRGAKTLDFAAGVKSNEGYFNK